MILIAFFILVTFVIPGFFYSQLFREERDIGNVSVENRKIFNDLVDFNSHGKKIPGILTQGVEFASLKVRSRQELETMMRIKASPLVQEAIPGNTEGREVQIKPLCLLMAYMCGLIPQEQINSDPHLRSDLEIILRAIPSYLDILIEECITLTSMLRLRQTHKRLSCQNILSIL